MASEHAITSVSRRGALVLGAGLAAVTTSPALAATSRTRPRMVDAHGSYRFKVGDFACLVVSDGQLDFPPQWYASNADAAGIKALLEKHHLPTDMVHNQTSGLVVDTGRSVLLAETGITRRWRSATGAPAGSLDRTGTLIPNLIAAGVGLGDVDQIFVSHGHPDHLGALLNDAGKPMFPRARIFYDRRDHAYHTAAVGTLTAQEQAERRVAREILTALRDRIELTDPGNAIASGITILDAAGHTPGHCGLMIRSAGERLFHGADLVAHYILSLARPEWSFYATLDKPAEIAARRKYFAQVAEERTRTFFCHVPFPSLGHVAREGQGFRWEPEYYTWA